MAWNHGRLAAAAPWRMLRSGGLSLYLSVSTRCISAASPWSISRSVLGVTSSHYSTSAASSRYTYDIAASFIAKDRAFDPSTHVFHFNPYNRIHPPRHSRRSSRPESGHDAFFVSRVNETGAVALGVADGVGGWVDSGVNPADFSHGFCDYMAQAAYEHQDAASHPLTARRLMQQGYDSICGDGSVQAGGSTACVAVASPDGILDVANLGDSGFLQLRLNAVHAYSEPQTHAFNTPFQLSVIPPSVAARMAAFGGEQLCDLPRDADVSQHRLRHGDVLVFATDGVLDNLFNQQILRIASRVMVASGAWSMASAKGVHAAESFEALTKPSGAAADAKGGRMGHTTLQSLLATELVTAAKLASINTKVDGPFAKEVKKYYPQEEWHGGKVDDICVVVVVVSADAMGSRGNTQEKEN